MGKERRKYPRFECSIRSEVLDFEGKSHLIKSAKILDFSRQGFKLGLEFTVPSPGSEINVKAIIPEKQIVTIMSGEVVWTKYYKNKMKLGLRLKAMDKRDKEKILGWVYSTWMEKKEKRKKKTIQK
jgi:c-di-GMP-binding flagellar brake protein YcgR